MKKVLAILLACLLTLSFSIPVFAIGEEMTVKKAAVTVDGKIDDAWAKASRQKLNYVKNNVPMPNDSYCYVSALWYGNTIYFLFEITDDDPSFNSTVGDWKNDGIYLFIEELGTGGKPFTAGQYQIAIIPQEGLSQLPRRGDANAMGKFAYAYEKTGTGYVIEASYTFNMITLSAGTEIKADFQYNDCNAAKERTHNFGWSDTNDSAVSDAAVWGTLKLSGAYAITVSKPAAAAEDAAEDPEANLIDPAGPQLDPYTLLDPAGPELDPYTLLDPVGALLEPFTVLNP